MFLYLELALEEVGLYTAKSSQPSNLASLNVRAVEVMPLKVVLDFLLQHDYKRGFAPRRRRSMHL